MKSKTNTKENNNKSSKEFDITNFYVFGGMKSTQRTKLHVADANGITLCGVKSLWMECYEEILKNGFIKGEEHLKPIQELECTCKPCLKKFLELNKLAS